METSPTSTQAQRGRAFAMEGDKILCNSWLEVSQDPVKGINQKKDRLWERIIVTFHAHWPSHYLEKSKCCYCFLRLRLWTFGIKIPLVWSLLLIEWCFGIKRSTLIENGFVC